VVSIKRGGVQKGLDMLLSALQTVVSPSADGIASFLQIPLQLHPAVFVQLHHRSQRYPHR
jgi:hypothetical protein